MPSSSEKPADKRLALDELDEKFAAFQALRKSDSAAADEILAALGASDEVDRDIVLELSSRRPLAYPGRFDEAHHLVVRSLEVLDRNGSRPVSVRGLGPLGPIAAFLIQQVAQFIVRTHQASLADAMKNLYACREANASRDDPAKRMLTVVCYQMERLTPGSGEMRREPRHSCFVALVVDPARDTLLVDQRKRWQHRRLIAPNIRWCCSVGFDW